PVAAHDPNVLDWLEKSIANGVAEALFFRSALHYGVGRKEEARENLNRAAAAGCPPAQTALALAWLEHAGEEAPQNGRAWLACAAENGDRAAEALMRGEHQPAPRGEMLPPAALPAWAASEAVDDWETLCATPSVKYAEAVLSPLECAWLRTSARPELKPSRILDPVTRRPRADPIRTSTAMNFGLPIAPVFVARLVERIASGAGLAAANGEPLAVLRYLPGQQYRAHRDALGREKLLHDPLRASGDRIATTLVYLNEPRAGGATAFPFLELQVEPRIGRLLIFRNMDDAGEAAQNAIHTGMPVTAGSKWLASLWLRERPVAESFAVPPETSRQQHAGKQD
ncbi:MAG: 2OG-Fe(II) oxygenase, partial [Gammaproteobacteria bacterium]